MYLSQRVICGSDNCNRHDNIMAMNIMSEISVAAKIRVC
jgi:hypothetical protein